MLPGIPTWERTLPSGRAFCEQHVQEHGFDSSLCFTQRVKLTTCAQDCAVLFLSGLRKKEEGGGRKTSGGLSSSQRAVQGDGGAAITHPLVAGRALRDSE